MARPLKIGEVARELGVSPDTLRHYERKGLLSRALRSHSGYRLYSRDVIEQVIRIRSALAIGFTIDELARVFAARHKGTAPCRQVRSMAIEKLAALEQQIDEMIHLRDHLKQVIGTWDAILKKTAAGDKAHLLDALTSVPQQKPGGKQ
jgi:DNA-binding transcriptional MerR regulator